jgi:hypothetical protein
VIATGVIAVWPGLGRRRGSRQVETAEAQGCVTDIEGGQTPVRGLDGDVALEPGLVCATPPDLGEGLRHPCRGLAHGVETRVGRVEYLLLGGDLGVVRSGQRGSG